MARKKEQRAYDSFKATLDQRVLKLRRIENLVAEGMSDVIGQNRKGATFWIENKALDEWPKRATTKPLASVFEPGQLPFMREWIEWGGHAFVLLRVETEFYLLDPMYDPRQMTTEQIINGALRTGKKAIYEYLQELV